MMMTMIVTIFNDTFEFWQWINHHGDDDDNDDDDDDIDDFDDDSAFGFVYTIHKVVTIRRLKSIKNFEYKDDDDDDEDNDNHI